jgi:hypothetical protein
MVDQLLDMGATELTAMAGEASAEKICTKVETGADETVAKVGLRSTRMTVPVPLPSRSPWGLQLRMEWNGLRRTWHPVPQAVAGLATCRRFDTTPTVHSHKRLDDQIRSRAYRKGGPRHWARPHLQPPDSGERPPTGLWALTGRGGEREQPVTPPPLTPPGSERTASSTRGLSVCTLSVRNLGELGT